MDERKLISSRWTYFNRRVLPAIWLVFYVFFTAIILIYKIYPFILILLFFLIYFIYWYRIIISKICDKAYFMNDHFELTFKKATFNLHFDEIKKSSFFKLTYLKLEKSDGIVFLIRLSSDLLVSSHWRKKLTSVANSQNS